MQPEVFAALERAGGAREADRVLLLALAWRESRFDPRAKNAASSARGLMQFTRAAWLEAVRDHGAAHGLGAKAAALRTDRQTGEVSAANHRVLADILALRDNPHLSAALAMARLEQQRGSLAAVLDRPVTDADLYLVHFLGSVGGRTFLRELARAPSHRAADVVSRDAVSANRNVFIARNGRHRSLREVHADVERMLHSQRIVHAILRERMGETTDRTAVASAPR
jgi:hypothetical protein